MNESSLWSRSENRRGRTGRLWVRESVQLFRSIGMEFYMGLRLVKSDGGENCETMFSDSRERT